jgi:hypothetical protein
MSGAIPLPSPVISPSQYAPLQRRAVSTFHIARIEGIPLPLTVSLQDSLRPVLVKPRLEILHRSLLPQFVLLASVPWHLEDIHKLKVLFYVHLDRSAFAPE